MDQLTHNLERIRRSVDSRMERLLIDRGLRSNTPISETAFGTVALPLHRGEEPLVISSGAVGRPMWERKEPVDPYFSATEQGLNLPAQAPTVMERSFFRRVLTRLGF